MEKINYIEPHVLVDKLICRYGSYRKIEDAIDGKLTYVSLSRIHQGKQITPKAENYIILYNFAMD